MSVLVIQCKSLEVENGVLTCMTLCKKWQSKMLLDRGASGNSASADKS